MMPFGLDDILLVVASASPLLWAKRGEVLRSGVCRTVSRATRNEARAAEMAEAATGHIRTPCALLPGLSVASGSLVRNSIVGKYVGEAERDYPCVPHRHFHHTRRCRLPVTDLINYSVKEVATSIGKYSMAEVCRLFEVIQQDGNWEAALTVTEGARSGGHYACLTKTNLEAAARTILLAGEAQKVVEYCLNFANEVLLSDEVLLAIFDACRNSEQKSLALYQTLKPFRSEWTSAVYACCLTVNAKFNWREALFLYNDYMEHKHRPRFGRFLTNLVNVTGVMEGSHEPEALVGSSRSQGLLFLYHIILPLVADRRPEQLQKCYSEMMVHDPESAVDVLLRCLHTAHGRELGIQWLKEEGGEVTSMIGSTAFTVYNNVVALANELYRRRPGVMNLNSLLKVIAAQNPALIPTCISEEIRQHVRHVSMSDNDAYVLARTLTDHSGHWKLASEFMALMISRKHFSVLPSLSHYVAREGRWALAAKAMTVCLSNRTALTQAELSLCVESSVLAGRWRSAFFWMERAHGCGLLLSSATYDSTMGVMKHCSWTVALRALISMQEAGCMQSEKGILNVLEAAAAQGKVETALRVVSTVGNIYWTA